MKELTDEQLDILADVDRSAWCKFQANDYHTDYALDKGAK